MVCDGCEAHGAVNFMGQRGYLCDPCVLELELEVEARQLVLEGVK